MATLQLVNNSQLILNLRGAKCYKYIYLSIYLSIHPSPDTRDGKLMIRALFIYYGIRTFIRKCLWFNLRILAPDHSFSQQSPLIALT